MIHFYVIIFFLGNIDLKDVIDYEKKLHSIDDFMCIELQNNKDVLDIIFISLDCDDDVSFKYEWNGYTLYIYQHIDEMD